MLIARPIKTDEEIEQSNEILKQYKIEDNANSENIKYILIIDGEIVGVSRVDIHGNNGVLKYVAIDKKEVKDDLGDALLRSIFNYCLNHNVDKVYYKESNEYLLKKSFVENKTAIDIDGEEKEFPLEIDLNTFFTMPCKGSCQGSKGMK